MNITCHATRCSRLRFYNGKLKDGDSVNARKLGSHLLRTVGETCRVLGAPLVVLDVKSREEKYRTSWVNSMEVDMVLDVIKVS